MQSKHNITRYKQKLLIFISALSIALILQPKQVAHASSLPSADFSSWAHSLVVNSTSSSTEGGKQSIKNGVLPNRTGYLCYLLTKDGVAVPGTQAYAFQSPGYNGVEGSTMWRAESRKGGYIIYTI